MFFFFFTFPVAMVCSDHAMDGLKNYKQLELPGVLGPESIAFDCNDNGPYAGVSDGRILKWRGPEVGWTEFAFTAPNRQREVCDGSTNTSDEPTCGRPLGLKFNPESCDLFIADAYFGLMVVGPNGGQAQQLVASAEGVPFRFTNALDIDSKTGLVYFTDSSIIYQRREYILAVIGGDRTGRLLKYDPHSKEVTVMFKGLAFPNGVALSKDNSFLLVAESTKFQVLRFWLQDSTIYSPQVFVRLPRFPDNIRTNNEGEFWVALNSARGKIRRSKDTELDSKTVRGRYDNDPVGVKIDWEGKIVKVLHGNDGAALDSVSEVEEHGGNLFMGSSVKPYVGVMEV
ncbi:protein STRICTOSIDINE SYNTHASE-LIKE 10-like [Pistacia vera]|uniref:protein STRICTOSIDINE SYNTHASE-LIKE 10-like n=1 Tax=Pistacia vera TaxID=55513 RepID=UPI0012637A9D|nr:protein STRICTOSIDINE SYNTHASE-LIKE 10-like [Pistacia vera]